MRSSEAGKLWPVSCGTESFPLARCFALIDRMEMPCSISGESLSRYLDGELPLLEYRQVREHVAACRSCTGRLRAYRVTTAVVARTMAGVGRPEGARPALWLSVAAALIASLATNLLLPRAEREAEPPVFSRSAPTSEGLSAFYAQVSPAASNPGDRD